MRIWRNCDHKPESQAVHIDNTVMKDLLAFLDDITREKGLVNSDFEAPLSNYLTSDVETIKYRQDIIKDLLDNSVLTKTLDELLKLCETWQSLADANVFDWNKLLDAMRNINEYNVITSKIINAINNVQDASIGLKELKTYIEENKNSTDFPKLLEWIVQCCSGMTTPRSLRYAIGINENYGIKSVGFLSVDDTYYPGVVGGYGARIRNFMKMVQAAQKAAGGGGGSYVAPLQKFNKYTREPSITDLEPVKPPDMNYDPMQAVTNPLDISDSVNNLMIGELKKAAFSIKTTIKQHIKWLIAKKPDIAFFLRSVRICKYLDSLGLPVCFPECFDISEKRFVCKDIYPIDLAVKLINKMPSEDEAASALTSASASTSTSTSAAILAATKATGKIVFNNVDFTKDRYIKLITGVNQGGKTTFLKAIAFIQFMFQIGIKVTCSSAEISPVDGIYTIFSRQEDNELPHGRLGQELTYIRQAFDNITSNSLILLNEPFASTSVESAVYLCKETLCTLLALRIRSIMVSHLYRLTSIQEMLKESEYQTHIVNMTTELEETQNGERKITYRIIEGVSDHNSRAVDTIRRIEAELSSR